jgi:hypothetical protein
MQANSENGGAIAATYCLCASLFDCIRSEIEALFEGYRGVKNLIEAITSQTGVGQNKS